MNQSSTVAAAVSEQIVSEQTAIGFYLVYAAVALALVVFLARTLYRNGAIFLKDVFEEDALADSVNQLLVIGFYLLNLGYALLLYRLQPEYQTITVAFNELVAKLGTLLVSLGVIHLLNMFIFWRIRTYRDRQRSTPPSPTFAPNPPQGFTPPQGLTPPPPFTPGPAVG